VGSQAVEADKVTGLTIGVAQNDKVLCVRPFGLANVEHQIPVTEKTVFRIGSITKEFTAVAILLLVEEGKVHLDDPLSKFVTEYPEPGASATVKQLLQHTSGIADLTRQPTFRQDRQIDLSPDEVLNRFKDVPTEFESGEKHRYCNSGYLLLARVIEEASGQPYHEFVEERLLKVVGMRETYVEGRNQIIPHRAAGYSRWGGKLRNATHVSLRISTGAGNMASTARDLLLWQQALVGHKILKKSSFELMTANGKLNNSKEFGYGLGVFIQQVAGSKVVRHGGGISGFRSDLAWYPESGFVIAVVANSNHAKPGQISQRIARRLLSDKSGQD
jgi:CubicO group peptidase (beta-lactamase class C family)